MIDLNVKNQLEEKYGVDFESDFFDDDVISLVEDTISATKNIYFTQMQMFADWLAENHFRLFNVETNNGVKVYFYKSESYKNSVDIPYSSGYLLIEFLKQHKKL
jgi:hypothetical protein